VNLHALKGQWFKRAVPMRDRKVPQKHNGGEEKAKELVFSFSAQEIWEWTPLKRSPRPKARSFRKGGGFWRTHGRERRDGKCVGLKEGMAWYNSPSPRAVNARHVVSERGSVHWRWERKDKMWKGINSQKMRQVKVIVGRRAPQGEMDRIT